MPLSTTSHGVRASSRGGVGPGQQAGHPVVAVRVPAALRLGVERELDVLGGAGPGDGDDRHVERDRLLGQEPRVAAAGGEADDLEAVGVGGDHLERLGADRAGRAEDDHVAGLVPWAQSPRCRRDAVAGTDGTT